MSDLFASGNSIGGSGPGGAGSSGRGAGGAGEYGKGAGGVGEYGTGAGGAGTFGSGAGGSGVGVNYDVVANAKDGGSIKSLWHSSEPSYNESSDIEVKPLVLTKQAESSEYVGATQDKTPYMIKSPFSYFMLSLLYPVIYIPLFFLVVNICIVLIGSIVANNPLEMPFIQIIGELVGICFVAYFHHYLVKKVKKQS